MPKNITSEVREIILKVKEFMDEEKRMQVPIIPLSKVYVRVSAATGMHFSIYFTFTRYQYSLILYTNRYLLFMSFL